MSLGRKTPEFDDRAPLLEASKVRVEIGGEQILESASLTLEKGELVAVVGPNGAGKSTFARAFCGLRRPEGGAIRWMGIDLSELRGRRLARVRAYVPQRAQVPNGVSVQAAVNIGRSTHLKPLQGLSGEDRDVVSESIARARMEGFEDRSSKVGCKTSSGEPWLRQLPWCSKSNSSTKRAARLRSCKAAITKAPLSASFRQIDIRMV